MDKKLKANHATQDEKCQKLEDEIFSRKNAPPSPPSFVKDAQERFLQNMTFLVLDENF